METMSYIGRKSCGCVVCAVVDDPTRTKDTAKHLASWVKAGLTIERVDNDYVREHFTWKCQHVEVVKRTDGQLALFE